MSQNTALPRWNLSSIYPSGDCPEHARDTAAVREGVAGLDRLLDRVDSPDGLAGYLAERDRVVRLFRTLHAWAYMRVSTDSFDAAARTALSAAERLELELNRHETRFRGLLAARPGIVGLAADPEADPLLRAHGFWLADQLERGRHQLPGDGEELAAELGLFGSKTLENLHGTLTSQAGERLDGAGERVGLARLRALAFDPNPAVRRSACAAELAACAAIREPAAACINGIKGTSAVLARRRGYPGLLERSLIDSRITPAVLEALLAAMRGALPVLRGYLKAKAALLGHPGPLPWADLFAPLPGAARTYSFAEARSLIEQTFCGFSPQLSGVAAEAFDRTWIDAEPRSGKVGGAYCIGIPADGTFRVLANFDGSFSSVVTLAHELGHGFHARVMTDLPVLLRGYPMTLAETASIFCQTLLTRTVLDAAPAGERLLILEESLSDAAQVIVDIYSRFLFESRLAERALASFVGPDELCRMMTSAQIEAYGDALDHQSLHPYLWLVKPHYYRVERPFYNYPYAFGLLFGLSLHAAWRREGSPFVDRYVGLLRETGSDGAVPLAARYGLEIEQPAFWLGGVETVAAEAEEYLRLAGKKP